MEIDYAQKLQKCHEYVEALEEEQKKIQVFQRELPLCLEIITKTIELCRKELSNMSEQAQDQSDCSEQTASVCVGPVFEEFIPMKKKTQQQEEEEEEEEEESFPQAVDTKKKSDWLQLWNQSDLVKKAKVIEVKSNMCGAFQPFKKEIKKPDFLEPAVVSAPAKTTSSTTEKGGDESDSVKDGEKETIQLQPRTQTQSQTQTHRKQRRCWSPELHRRFLNALQQLGGSHVATPKQIRDYMKVDGLTNDEVKSHLQKYRLHTRRPTTSAAAHSNINSQPPPPQFAVVAGGIWVHSPHHVAAQSPPPPPQSPKGLVERSSSCCNLQATSMNRTTSSSPVS